MIGKLLPFLSKIKSQFIDCFVSLCQLTSQKNIQKAEEFKLDAHLFKYINIMDVGCVVITGYFGV